MVNKFKLKFRKLSLYSCLSTRMQDKTLRLKLA